MALGIGPGLDGRGAPGSDESRCGGGGVAGARGITLGDAAMFDGGDSGSVAGNGAVAGNGGADVTVPDGSGSGDAGGTQADGCEPRSGGGGGPERRVWGPLLPGKMPRAEGGEGMRDVSPAPPAGRGTTLTGRGGTLTGPGAWGCFAASLGPAPALGSFSSPIIEHLAAELSRRAP